MRLFINCHEHYRSEYEELRRSFIYDPEIANRTREMCDSWDNQGKKKKSRYLDLVIDGDLALIMRLTLGNSRAQEVNCRGVTQDWTKGQNPAPWGDSVVDISRVVTVPKFRGLGLYRAAFLCAELEVRAWQGAEYLCSIVKHDLEWPLKVLNELGHWKIPMDQSLISYDVPGQPVKVYPMCLKLRSENNRLQDKLKSTIAYLGKKGINCPYLEDHQVIENRNINACGLPAIA